MSSGGDGADLWSAMSKVRPNEADQGTAPSEARRWQEEKEERADRWATRKAMLRRKRNPAPTETGKVYYKLYSDHITAPFTAVDLPSKKMSISRIREAIQDDRGSSVPGPDIPADLYDPNREMWLNARYTDWSVLQLPLYLMVKDDIQVRTRKLIEGLFRKKDSALGMDEIWEYLQETGETLEGVTCKDDVMPALNRMVKDRVADQSWVRNPKTERKTKVPGWHLNSTYRLKLLTDTQNAYLDARTKQQVCIETKNTDALPALDEKVDKLRQDVEAMEAEFDAGMHFYRRTLKAVVAKRSQDIDDGILDEAIKWDQKKRWKGYIWTDWWVQKAPHHYIDTDNILEYTGKEASTFWHEFLDLDSPIRKTTLYRRRIHPSIDEMKKQGVWVKKTKSIKVGGNPDNIPA